MNLINNMLVFETLKQLKQKGMIRAYGMSTKTIEGGLATVDKADCVMATFNLTRPEEKPVLARATEQKKGILLKKVFNSGHLF